MKLDLKKLKKLHQTDKDATFVSHHGHKITVNLSKLSPEMRDAMTKLPKFEGGETHVKGAMNPKLAESKKQPPKPVRMYDSGGGVNIDTTSGSQEEHDAALMRGDIGVQAPTHLTGPETSQESAAASGEVAAPAKPKVNIDKGASAKERADFSSAFAKGGNVPQYADGTPDEPVTSVTLDPAKLGIPDAFINPDAGHPGTGSPQPSDPNAPPDVPGIDPEQWAKMVAQRTAQPTPSQGERPPVATQAPQQSSPDAMDNYAKNVQGGYQQELEGLKGEAAAQTQLGKEQQQVATAGQTVAQQHQDDTQNLQANMLDQNQKFMADLQNQHIDPSHAFQTLPLGRLGSTIGLILGGIGSGISGGPNQALQALQSHIDRDIDAQKANIGIKQSLLSHNLEMYRSLPAAEAATRMAMNNTIDYMAQKAVAHSKGPMAQAAYQKMAGELQQRNAFILGQVQAPGANPAGAVDDGVPQKIQMFRLSGNEPLAKNLEEKYLPGLGMAKVPVPPQAREQFASMQNFDSQMRDLYAFAQKHGGTVLDRGTVNEGRAKAQAAQNAYRGAQNLGVFKQSEAPLLEGEIPSDPTAFGNYIRALPQYRAVMDNNNRKLNNYASSFGVTPFSSSRQAHPQQAGGGVRFQKGK